MVYSAFLPTIEKVNHKTQLQSFEKYNLEKKNCKNHGISGYTR